MVVDDAAIVLELAGRYLRAAGHEVELVESGALATSLLVRNTHDLVVLDYMMPGMDGHELLAWLRENQATRTLPVLFLTSADDDPEVLARAFKLGATAAMLKPIDRNSFTTCVSALLELPRDVP